MGHLAGGKAASLHLFCLGEWLLFFWLRARSIASRVIISPPSLLLANLLARPKGLLPGLDMA
jgi:hypothetical protein